MQSNKADLSLATVPPFLMILWRSEPSEVPSPELLQPHRMVQARSKLKTKCKNMFQCTRPAESQAILNHIWSYSNSPCIPDLVHIWAAGDKALPCLHGLAPALSNSTSELGRMRNIFHHHAWASPASTFHIYRLTSRWFSLSALVILESSGGRRKQLREAHLVFT